MVFCEFLRYLVYMSSVSLLYGDSLFVINLSFPVFYPLGKGRKQKNRSQMMVMVGLRILRS